MIDLDRIAKNDKPQFGELKMTIAQFFRIDGGTTQLHGVTPDILFPPVSDAANFGESSFENALPWSRVKAADYVPAGDLKGVVPILLAMHEARVRQDKGFRYLQEDIAESRLQRTKNLISLNEAERRKERDAQQARLASRELPKNAGKTSPEHAGSKTRAAGTGDAPRDDGLQAGERSLASELAAEKAQKSAKDVLLNEAVHILSDEVAVRADGARIAARVKSRPASIPD
jgi:carboxyl-terminal processing protease